MLVGTGGRGDAVRWARGPGDDDCGVGDTLIDDRESLGGTTNPFWVRAGLGGRRHLPEVLPGTWREL